MTPTYGKYIKVSHTKCVQNIYFDRNFLCLCNDKKGLKNIKVR